MKFIHSITFKFTLWYLLVLSVLLVLLSTGVYFNLSRTLYRNLDEALKARAAQLIHIRHIVGIIRDGRFEENPGEIVLFSYRSEGGLVQVSPRGRTLPVSDELVRRVMDGTNSLSMMETAAGRKLRVFALPYYPRPEDLHREPPPPGAPPPFHSPPRGRPPEFGGLQGHRPPPPPRPGELPPHQRQPIEGPAALFVAQPTGNIEMALSGLLTTLLIAVPLTLLIAGGGGVFLAGRVLKPVQQITEAAQTIGERDLSRRIDVHTSDELGTLAATLNAMVERLQKAFERQRQFTGDASHELRSPLAVIEAEATLALSKDRSAEEYGESLATVAREAEHMSRIIDRLLKLARSDAGRETLSFEEVGLDEIVAAVGSGLQKRCEEKGIDLKLHLEKGPMFMGDRAMLRLLFTNVLENAIRYTPSGGSITVTLRPKGEGAIVSISDTGVGISTEDLPHIFDRFYRVDKSRTRAEGGSGLGLAICRQIALLHGGSIDVESEVGRGSTFTVRLNLQEVHDEKEM